MCEVPPARPAPSIPLHLCGALDSGKSWLEFLEEF